MHSCMVKASKTCLTADANYGLTGLFYAQTNTIYRFYGYELVIDDAPAIIYASIGHCKIWDQQICLWAHRVRRSEVAEKMSQNLTFFWFGRAPARIFLDCSAHLFDIRKAYPMIHCTFTLPALVSLFCKVDLARESNTEVYLFKVI